jgi:hypothetical protein
MEEVSSKCSLNRGVLVILGELEGLGQYYGGCVEIWQLELEDLVLFLMTFGGRE